MNLKRLVTLNQKGFTLVEILLVLGILGAAIGIMASRVNKNNNNNIKSVVRHMTVTVREIRNQAKLKNSTYRLVINFDESPPTYTVERASGRAVRLSKEDIESRDKMDKDERPPEPFQRDTYFGKKPKELPKPLKFGSLETINMREPMTAGTGYIYFSPEGFAEYSALQITNGKDLTWTLVFNPLTGQADIIQQAKALKDLKQ